MRPGSVNLCFRSTSNPALARARSRVRSFLYFPANSEASFGLSARIPEWLELAAEGKFLEAAEISRATSNMPEICPRVCPQERLCEGACVVHDPPGAICIGAIEKFINEYALARGAVPIIKSTPNGKRVAVVGAGPGGLACADELSKLGYAVTIFESQLLPGGLLLFGIPAFKLEKAVVERRINIISWPSRTLMARRVLPI
jgi:glutamate synthase (NADPH) small chain